MVHSSALRSQEIAIGGEQASVERRRRLPAHASQTADVHQLARGAVGLARVEHDLALEADHAAHGAGEFADAEVLAHTDVHQRCQAVVTVLAQQGLELRVGQLHQEDAGVGHVVGVEKLALRRTGSPHRDHVRARHLRFVELADQRGDDVAVFRVVVVAGPVEVRGHGRKETGAVLAVVAPAHFDAGDLGQRVGPVGGLQRPSEEVFFLHRLRRELGIDAARAEEQQPLHAMLPGRVDHVGLDGEVVAYELGRIGVVGDDATHLGRGEKDVVRLFLREEGFGGSGVGEVQLGVGAQQELVEPPALKIAHDGRANQATMAGDEDSGVGFHGLLAVHSW